MYLKTKKEVGQRLLLMTKTVYRTEIFVEFLELLVYDLRFYG